MQFLFIYFFFKFAAVQSTYTRVSIYKFERQVRKKLVLLRVLSLWENDKETISSSTGLHKINLWSGTMRTGRQ